MNLSVGRGGLGSSTIIIIVIAAAAIIFGGYVISTLTPSLLPVQASGEAEQVDGLFRVLMFLGGIVFLLVQGLLVVTIIRFRRKPGDESDGAHFSSNLTLEIVWTAIPAITIVFLAIYSYNVFVSIREPKPDELHIGVSGARFAWTFTYEDPLGRLPVDGPQTFNDAVLHTYVGRPVVLTMQTSDVNHAFWVPTMRIKQDLLAGRTTDVRFTPILAGRYRVACAELCGGGHGSMFSYVQVYANEQEWMDRFIDVRVERILNPPTDPVEVGRSLLTEGKYPCAGCHKLDDLGWAGVTGPNLNGLADTAARRASTAGEPSAESYIANSVRHPNDYTVPGFQKNVMPQFGPTETEPAEVDGAYYLYMPDEDLVNIISYLCTQSATGTPTCGDTASIEQAVAAQSE
ncbi:MAG: hypothetical protein DWB44_00945 [Chloroflexi bacterium]|nr:hypothetical protein [Chloroflexota bacterium]MDL1914972.1 hypothetical protein [Anaerolineae bacterium CFX4]